MKEALRVRFAKRLPTRDDIKKMFEAEWKKITPAVFERYVAHYRERLQAVIDAKGGHSGY